MTQNNFKVRQNLLTDKQIYHKVTENNDKLQLWLYSHKKGEKSLKKYVKWPKKEKNYREMTTLFKKKEHKEKKQLQGYAKMTTDKRQMCNKVTQNHIGTQNVLKWHKASTKQHITLKIHEKNNNKEKWNDNKNTYYNYRHKMISMTHKTATHIHKNTEKWSQSYTKCLQTTKNNYRGTL